MPGLPFNPLAVPEQLAQQIYWSGWREGGAVCGVVAFIVGMIVCHILKSKQ